jgi:hypothetical protein
MITPEQLAKSGTEDGNQAALFCWAALPETLRRYPDIRWMFAIPNGGSRIISQGARLKAGGVKPGVPDICLPVRKNAWAGLFIELKKLQGRVRDNQNDYLVYLNQAGYYATVCYGWEFAKMTIIWYMDGPVIEENNAIIKGAK